jgi:nitrate reductase NapE component
MLGQQTIMFGLGWLGLLILGIAVLGGAGLLVWMFSRKG